MDEAKLQEAVAAREAAETKLAEAEARTAELEAENARLKEGELLREARAFVTDSLPAELPEITRARLQEALSAKPIITEGALDKDAFKEAIDAAVMREVEYLAGISESGRIRGMGAPASEATAEADRQALRESFMRAGLTEAEAEIAAFGR